METLTHKTMTVVNIKCKRILLNVSKCIDYLLAYVHTLNHDMSWKEKSLQTMKSVDVPDTDSFQCNCNALQNVQVIKEKVTNT